MEAGGWVSFTHLALKAAGERWAVHAAEEWSHDISMAAVASERNPFGDKMPRAGCRRRLLLCERLRRGGGGKGQRRGRGLRVSCWFTAIDWSGCSKASTVNKDINTSRERHGTQTVYSYRRLSLPAVPFVRRRLSPHELYAAAVLHVASVCVHAWKGYRAAGGSLSQKKRELFLSRKYGLKYGGLQSSCKRYVEPVRRRDSSPTAMGSLTETERGRSIFGCSGQATDKCVHPWQLPLSVPLSSQARLMPPLPS